MIALRDARAADRAGIEAVRPAAYEQYAATLGAALWVVSRQNIVATLAAAKPGEQIAAEDGGAIVGGVLLYPAGAVMGPGQRSACSRCRRLPGPAGSAGG